MIRRRPRDVMFFCVLLSPVHHTLILAVAAQPSSLKSIPERTQAHPDARTAGPGGSTPRRQSDGLDAEAARQLRQKMIAQGLVDSDRAKRHRISDGGDDDDREGFSAGATRPVRPVATKNKGDSLYSSLLHMGLTRAAAAEGEEYDDPKQRAPPKRLSSFVNNVVQKGGLPGGFKMDAAGPSGAPSDVARRRDSDDGNGSHIQESAQARLSLEFALKNLLPACIECVRARRGVVRQNSNLTDSVLTQRSLLGTADDGNHALQHPAMGGFGMQRRLPQRAATVRCQNIHPAVYRPLPLHTKSAL
eukprot:scaffold160720_cov42-Prasinocladus_malaysianus.AAC.2